MTTTHHQVPTHLDVEDKVLFGLTVRQCVCVGPPGRADPLGVAGRGAGVCGLATSSDLATGRAHRGGLAAGRRKLARADAESGLGRRRG